MIFKSYIVEQNIQCLSGYKIFLFYGENEGLKRDLKKNLRVDNKDSEILNLFQDEIIKNKKILISEIINKSLFGKKKVFFINEANDKILEVLEEIIEHIDDEKIFLFSEVLDKKSKLRSFFEKSKNFAATPCYPDNDITIRKKIADNLRSYNGLSAEIINLIIQAAGLDRNKVNNEIEKIKSYFTDKKISSDKISLLLNIKTTDDFNLIKDEAINGNKRQTNRLLADTVFVQENIIYYLNLINQRINKLNEIANIRKHNTNIDSLITDLKPPVFWKDKPMLINQSKKWDKTKIKTALEKTYNAELEIKTNSSIRKDLIIKNLLIDLCLTANAS